LKELEEAGVAVLDCEHKTPPDAGSGHPYIAIPNLVAGRIDLTNVRRIADAQLEEWTRRTRPQGGDIIITRRARVGDSAVIPNGLRCAIGQNLVILRSLGDRVDQNFLRWAVRGPTWFAEVDRLRNVGAVFDSLNVRDVARMRVPLPPLTEQRAIAEVLGALDDKIEANCRIASLVLRSAEARYRLETSDSTRFVSLREAGKWLSGGTPSTSNPLYWNGNTPWISASSLKSFYVADSERRVTDLGVSNGTRIVPRGTVLFVVRGMSLEKEFRVGVAQREVAFGQDSKAILPDPQIGSSTLGVALSAMRNDILVLVDEAGHGTGRLSTDRLERLRVPLPPKMRALEVEAMLSSLIASGAGAVSENHSLRALSDALLPKLLSGKLRVRDAAVLVEEAM
jgi:type I restriction enzyme S subunit